METKMQVDREKVYEEIEQIFKDFNLLEIATLIEELILIGEIASGLAKANGHKFPVKE